MKIGFKGSTIFIHINLSNAVLEKYYDVLLAESGKEALEMLETELVDLVLLDIAMPQMNGIETFKHIKDFTVKIPVIFLTASGYEEDVRTAINLGAVNYLKKPFFPQDLLKRVAKGLEEQ